MAERQRPGQRRCAIRCWRSTWTTRSCGRMSCSSPWRHCSSDRGRCSVRSRSCCAVKPAMKAALARLVDLDVGQLPANDALVEWLRRQRDSGRRLALYSAANEEIVLRVAERFGIFEFAQGSDGRVNLRGDRKCDAIEARYGTAFSYIGDSRRDLPIWRRCGRAVLVGDVDRLRRSLPATVTVEATFPQPRGGPVMWLSALRIHQWVKNLLVFVPLLLSGHLEVKPFASAVLAFLALGLVASATYVVNDLMDLASDRSHPVKRQRPFASGALSIRAGLVAVLLLGAAAGMLASAPLAAIADRHRRVRRGDTRLFDSPQGSPGPRSHRPGVSLHLADRRRDGRHRRPGVSVVADVFDVLFRKRRGDQALRRSAPAGRKWRAARLPAAAIARRTARF